MPIAYALLTRCVFVPRSVTANSNIKGSGAAFGEALKANKSLKELNMFRCSLEAEDGKGLAGGLAVNGWRADKIGREGQLAGQRGHCSDSQGDGRGIRALFWSLETKQ